MKTTAPAAPAPTRPNVELLYVKVDLIDFAENVRKTFDAAEDKQLADSVRAHGVINPVTLREHPTKKGRYLLTAGHRRLNAAKVAGLEEVPATVRDTESAETVELVQLVENIQRKDLEPVEEARGLKKLMDSGKHTVEQLADMVDRSAGYVYRATRLLELPVKILAEIEAGDLTPAHGHQLLRVPAQEREKTFASWKKSFEYREGMDKAKDLGEYLEGKLSGDLAKAEFPKGIPFADAPACDSCPSNSGNQGMLFDGVKKGDCTFLPCFQKKEQAHFDGKVSRIKQVYPKAPVLSTKYCYSGTTVNGYEAVTRYSAEKAAALKTGAIIVCNGEIWIAKKTPAATSAKSPKSAPSVERRSPKEAFMDRFIDAELFKQLVASAEPDYVANVLLESALSSYISQGWKDRLELVGLPGTNDAINKAAAKMKPEEKVQLAFKVVAARNCAYGPADRHARDAGIDAKAFKKKTTAAADKAWEARKK